MQISDIQNQDLQNIWKDVTDPQYFNNMEPLLKTQVKEQISPEMIKIKKIYIAMFDQYIVKYEVNKQPIIMRGTYHQLWCIHCIVVSFEKHYTEDTNKLDIICTIYRVIIISYSDRLQNRDYLQVDLQYIQLLYCLLFKNQEYQKPIQYVQMEFNLRIEWIMKKSTGYKYGFNLFYDRNIKFIIILSDDQILSVKFYPIIKQRLNQSNFHENYKAYKKIGKGNFASVYLVQHKLNKQKFAVKAFSKQAAYQQFQGKEAIVNEIQLMRKIDNQYLIKLYEVFETENSIYMVMELLEGGSLLEYLRQRGKIYESQTKKILKCLLRGIDYLDQNKIMHRDIKPENILFKNKNSLDEPCIVDFGLASRFDIDNYLFVRCGTPGFVAPEIANLKSTNEKQIKYNSKVDVFSVGVIMHSMLLGRILFKGSDYNEVLQLNKICNIDFDDKIYDNITEQAKDLMIKMLQKNPYMRPSAEQALTHPYFQESEECNYEYPDVQDEIVINSNMMFNNNLIKAKDNKEFKDSMGTFKMNTQLFEQQQINTKEIIQGSNQVSMIGKMNDLNQPSLEQQSTNKISLNAKMLQYQKQMEQKLKQKHMQLQMQNEEFDDNKDDLSVSEDES